MSSTALTVACKELRDHARDTRGLASASLYALMGPVIVGLVMTVSGAGAGPGSDAGTGAQGAMIVSVMAAVFTLVAAFTGSMSVTMDMIAGERERRSLLPLLVNGVPRRELMIGKWLAASVFAVAGALLTLAAFAGVLATLPVPGPRPVMLWLVPPLVSLAALAAGLELLVSTQCRNVKEANTYLSLLVFSIVGIGMWLAFRSDSGSAWALMPIVGQERLLERAFAGGALPIVESIGLTMTTLAAAVLPIAAAAKALQRDAIVYGH